MELKQLLVEELQNELTSNRHGNLAKKFIDCIYSLNSQTGLLLISQSFISSCTILRFSI